MPRYRYDALPGTKNDHFSIRLLTLCPGKRKSALRCSIKTVQISLEGYSIEYEALSYYWGDPTAITVIGKNMTGEMPLHENLYDALVGLRNVTTERTLWTDAICINQSDINERTAQVRIMHKIYQAALNVVIWLANPGLPYFKWNPKKAFEVIERYYRLSQDQPAMTPLRRSTSTSVKKMFTSAGDRKVRAILACPWFSRMWIIQEVSCSKKATIACDDGSYVDFGHFLHGLRFAVTFSDCPIQYIL